MIIPRIDGTVLCEVPLAVVDSNTTLAERYLNSSILVEGIKLPSSRECPKHRVLNFLVLEDF